METIKRADQLTVGDELKLDNTCAHPVNVPCWRVLAWNPVQLCWTVRSTHDDQAAAAEHAEALRHADSRARVRVAPGIKRVLTVKPAPASSGTRAWREHQAAVMSDRFDALKRYKSPG